MEIQKSRFAIFYDIFPNYDIFKEWYKSTPLSDGDNDVPSKKTFTLIAYEFNDSHSAYSKESFRQKFANVLYTYYKEFEATNSEILKLMNMTDDEIAIADQTVTNMANVPETESSTDAETIDFVSQQQKTINRKGNLQIRREQLSNKRTFSVKTFLNRFRSLFIRIISEPYMSVIVEEDNL